MGLEKRDRGLEGQALMEGWGTGSSVLSPCCVQAPDMEPELPGLSLHPGLSSSPGLSLEPWLNHWNLRCLCSYYNTICLVEAASPSAAR